MSGGRAGSSGREPCCGLGPGASWESPECACCSGTGVSVYVTGLSPGIGFGQLGDLGAIT